MNVEDFIGSNYEQIRAVFLRFGIEKIPTPKTLGAAFVIYKDAFANDLYMEINSRTSNWNMPASQQTSIINADNQEKKKRDFGQMLNNSLDFLKSANPVIGGLSGAIRGNMQTNFSLQDNEYGISATTRDPKHQQQNNQMFLIGGGVLLVFLLILLFKK